MNSNDPWGLEPAGLKLASVRAGDALLRPGERVRLTPSGGADIFDLALQGQVATIASIEQDFEGEIYLAVTVDGDPGRDLGAQLKPGHRFFFRLDEIEPLYDDAATAIGHDHAYSDSATIQNGSVHRATDTGLEAAPPAPVERILIAGIGNIFFGDDAFGVEVAQRLIARELPAGVRVVDFGIRGLDLTYALLDGWDAAILVDAVPRGQPPGTLYVIEPDIADSIEHGPGGDRPSPPQGPAIEAHHLDPVRVLRLVHDMGGRSGRVLIVGCEPSPLETYDIESGLSPAVQGAVDEAVALVESLVERLLAGTFCAATH